MRGPILLTNDDGYGAPGLLALERVLGKEAEVWVVAPDREQSASSHALTLHKPLRIKQRSERGFTVSGTPTDSVLLGLRVVLPQKPALVISGINRGPNLGDNVSYSGTASAALEACLQGTPAIATSRLFGKEALDWDQAACCVRDIVATLESWTPAPRSFLNINIPGIPVQEIRGVQVTRLGDRRYSDEIVESQDPRGRPYYWIGGQTVTYDTTPGTDTAAVQEGWISLSPVTANWDQDPQEARLDDLGLETLSW